MDRGRGRSVSGRAWSAAWVCVVAFGLGYADGARGPAAEVGVVSRAEAQSLCAGRPQSCEVSTRDDSGCCRVRAPGGVNIESTPPGATAFVVSLLGQWQHLGVTPMRGVRITRGIHTLVFRLPRHRDSSLTINVTRQNETFRTALDPYGEITISPGNESANGARVLIDSHPAGVLPMQQQMVEPGRHLIQIQREGYVTFSQWVHLRAQQPLSLTVVLEREASAAACASGEHLSAGHCCVAGAEWVAARSACVCLDTSLCGPTRSPAVPNWDDEMAPGRLGASIQDGQRWLWPNRSSLWTWAQLPVAGEYEASEVRYFVSPLAELATLPLADLLQPCRADHSSYLALLYVRDRLVRVSIRLSPACTARERVLTNVEDRYGLVETAPGVRSVVRSTDRLATMRIEGASEFVYVEWLALDGPALPGAVLDTPRR
jgi:hypothetical protein